MPRLVVVTSMHAEGWRESGERCVSSFLKMWPADVSLEIYAEGFTAANPDPRIIFKDFHSYCGEKSDKFEAIYRALLTRLGVGTVKNYRFQASKFAKKGFVITDALRRHAGERIIWLDADVISIAPLSAEMLDQLTRLDHREIFCVHLRRFGRHTESGFLSFNTAHPICADFIGRYESIYLSGAVFHLEGWTDCHVFDCVKAVHVSDGFGSAYFELPSCGNKHVFINSPLGLVMDHLKGNRKKEIESRISDYLIPPRTRVKFDGRYAQLNPLIRLFKPRSFIEIGTWSGWRAVQMAMAASAYSDQISYRGYDVFEAGSAELDSKEKNVKPHFSQASVHQLLEFCRFLIPGFSFDLIAGDTHETLLRGDRADFAFIDGGHALGTIESDFESLSGTDVILLDDYYEGAIDTDSFGCNRVLEGIPHRVLPIADGVAGGGLVKFAVVSSETNLRLIDQQLLPR